MKYHSLRHTLTKVTCSQWLPRLCCSNVMFKEHSRKYHKRKMKRLLMFKGEWNSHNNNSPAQRDESTQRNEQPAHGMSKNELPHLVVVAAAPILVECGAPDRASKPALVIRFTGFRRVCK